MKDLQQRQADYDAKYWDHAPGEMEKIRHITLHMGKLLGKLSTYCEAKEHGSDMATDVIRDEVVSDLLVYSFQLSNLLGADAESRFLKRLEANIWKFGP